MTSHGVNFDPHARPERVQMLRCICRKGPSLRVRMKQKRLPEYSIVLGVLDSIDGERYTEFEVRISANHSQDLRRVGNLEGYAMDAGSKV